MKLPAPKRLGSKIDSGLASSLSSPAARPKRLGSNYHACGSSELPRLELPSLGPRLVTGLPAARPKRLGSKIDSGLASWLSSPAARREPLGSKIHSGLAS